MWSILRLIAVEFPMEKKNKTNKINLTILINLIFFSDGRRDEMLLWVRRSEVERNEFKIELASSFVARDIIRS